MTHDNDAAGTRRFHRTSFWFDGNVHNPQRP